MCAEVKARVINECDELLIPSFRDREEASENLRHVRLEALTTAGRQLPGASSWKQNELDNKAEAVLEECIAKASEGGKGRRDQGWRCGTYLSIHTFIHTSLFFTTSPHFLS